METKLLSVICQIQFRQNTIFIHSDGPPSVWIISLDLDGDFSLYFKAFRESLNPAPDHTLVLTSNPNPDTDSYYLTCYVIRLTYLLSVPKRGLMNCFGSY